MAVVRPLLMQGNQKLGEAIHHFDIPAIGTCPGSSELCRRICYASTGRFLLASVKERLDWCYTQSLRSDFAVRLVKEIVRKGVLVIRAHTSGDLYDERYAKAWLTVMKRCPKVRFYLYSRSWRIPKIAQVLEKMSELKNARIWFSIDSETGLPQSIPVGVRLAYLQVTEDERPDQYDLLFRVRKLRKKIPLPMTCPHETPKGKEHHTTCGSCGKCFRD